MQTKQTGPAMAAASSTGPRPEGGFPARGPQVKPAPRDTVGGAQFPGPPPPQPHHSGSRRSNPQQGSTWSAPTDPLVQSLALPASISLPVALSLNNKASTANIVHPAPTSHHSQITNRRTDNLEQLSLNIA